MANTKDTPDSQNSQNSDNQHSEHQHSEHQHSEKRHSSREHTAEKKPKPMEVLRHARTQLAELTGMAAENVSSFERTEDGWSLEIEVLELSRVPDTMSLMASYQVDLDPEGQLTGYRRVRRYERGRADAHRPGGR
ncbi:gas vesicle protein [Streptomyces sp. NPDC005648]|uniref:gas vesicle protein GvpO n=1 Tax=Streptomyces sp. NPDC005648 TaxID=3157044 RepID=UPI0033BE880B